MSIYAPLRHFNEKKKNRNSVYFSLFAVAGMKQYLSNGRSEGFHRKWNKCIRSEEKKVATVEQQANIKSLKNMNRIESELHTVGVSGARSEVVHRWHHSIKSTIHTHSHNSHDPLKSFQIVYIRIGFHSSDDGLCCFTVPFSLFVPAHIIYSEINSMISKMFRRLRTKCSSIRNGTHSHTHTHTT